MLRYVPNILTGLRLVAAPFAAVWIVEGYDTRALIIFILAGLSDAADGFLAKRYGLQTPFGAWLDPAADKLLMFVCFVALTWGPPPQNVSPIWVAVLVIGRDIAIVLGVTVAWLFRLPLQVRALPVGKANTVVQVVYIAMLLVMMAFDIVMPQIVLIAAIITSAFTLASWFAYGGLFAGALFAGRKPV